MVLSRYFTSLYHHSNSFIVNLACVSINIKELEDAGYRNIKKGNNIVILCKYCRQQQSH